MPVLPNWATHVRQWLCLNSKRRRRTSARALSVAVIDHEGAGPPLASSLTCVSNTWSTSAMSSAHSD
jgi:hypothetical protein